MSRDNFINIDHLAALSAQKLVKDTSDGKKSSVDSMITRALGVIQEDGVYAAALFLCSRSSDKKIAEAVMKSIMAFITQLGEAMKFGWEKLSPSDESSEKMFEFLTKYVTVDLERLLMIREALERMMIYARYGVKARRDPNKARDNELEGA